MNTLSSSMPFPLVKYTYCGRDGCNQQLHHDGPHDYEMNVQPRSRTMHNLLKSEPPMPDTRKKHFVSCPPPKRQHVQDVEPSRDKQSVCNDHLKNVVGEYLDPPLSLYWCKGYQEESARPILRVTFAQDLTSLKGTVRCSWYANVSSSLLGIQYTSMSDALSALAYHHGIPMGASDYTPDRKNVLCVNAEGRPDRLINYISNGTLEQFIRESTGHRALDDDAIVAFIYVFKAQGVARPKLGLSNELYENMKRCNWKGGCGWVGGVPDEFLGREYNSVRAAFVSLTGSTMDMKHCFVTTPEGDKTLVKDNLSSIENRPAACNIPRLGAAIQTIAPTSDTSSDTLSLPIATDSTEDTWDSFAKQNHRIEFARACASVKHRGGGILVLTTRWGGDVVQLLAHGFSQSDIWACNNCVEDPDTLNELKKKFPQINIVSGDIVEVAMQKEWLGIWYDMTCTWVKEIDGVKEWDSTKIPRRFDNAWVVAVSLSHRNTGCAITDHADDLSNLLIDKERKSSRQGGVVHERARPYKGRTGKMNMVFAIAFYTQRPLYEPSDYKGSILKVPVAIFNGRYANADWTSAYRVKDGHLFALVSGRKEHAFIVNFYDKNGFLIKEVEDWFPTIDDVKTYFYMPM